MRTNFPGFTKQHDASDPSDSEDEGEVTDTEGLGKPFVSAPVSYPLPLRVSGEEAVTTGNNQLLRHSLAESPGGETRHLREIPELHNFQRNPVFPEYFSYDVLIRLATTVMTHLATSQTKPIWSQMMIIA